MSQMGEVEVMVAARFHTIVISLKLSKPVLALLARAQGDGGPRVVRAFFVRAPYRSNEDALRRQEPSEGAGTAADIQEVTV